MGQITPSSLRIRAEQALRDKQIHFKLSRAGHAVSAVFGHIQYDSLARSGLLDHVGSAVAVLADMSLLARRTRELGAATKDPLSPRMCKRAEDGLLEASQAELGTIPLHRTFDELSIAVFKRAQELAVSRLEDKLRLDGTHIEVAYDQSELLTLDDGECERTVTLNLSCVPHRWGVEDALSPMITTGTFRETVSVCLKRLHSSALAAFIDLGEEASHGPHVISPSHEDWESHAPLHLLELTGLTQSEALTLKAHQLLLDNMNPASEADLAAIPEFFGRDHLGRMRDVGTTLRRLGLNHRAVSFAYHYGDNPESNAMRKLLAKYPEGVVLATSEDMARDFRMRQAWLAEHKRPLLESRHDFLTDPEQDGPDGRARKTQVFVRQRVRPDVIWRSEDLLTTLRTRAKSAPIQIQAIFKGALMTVKVKVASEPNIEFGYSAPQGNQESDLGEIRRILRAHGVPTTLVSDPIGAL
jgi:hypothetical protein